MWIATCNRFASLTPELKRRFRFGTFFFDLPTSEERVLIWQLYCKKFNVSGELPNDTGWTGAEIRNCCTIAYRLKLSLREAAEFIEHFEKSKRCGMQ
jgi:SpoVK/Ycf46/Vps4 family AAA+-type ATPase